MASFAASLSVFTLAIWAFCFTYTLFSMPENWAVRAHWFLKEGDFTYDCLTLTWHERMVLAVLVSVYVSISTMLGLMAHLVIPTFTTRMSRESRSVREKLRKIEGEELLMTLARDYAKIAAAAVVFGAMLYGWCTYAFASRTGNTYYYASKFFTEGTPFARVSAGFFTSVFVMSYIDPLGLRRMLGMKSPAATSASWVVGVGALTGLGGLGGVGGTAYIILADISVQSITLARWMMRDSVLQPMWQYLVQHHGPTLAAPSFSVVLPVSFYFGACCMFMLLDLSSSTWLAAHRIQPAKPPSWSTMRPALMLTLWNQVLYVLPAAALSILCGSPLALPSEAPTLIVLTVQVLLCLVTFDFCYFAWHWLFHKWRWGFRCVHSVHHRYNATFAWVTQYVHPIELLVTGLFSAVTPMVYSCHPLTTWAWTLVNIWVSIDAHCGYDFPWSLHNWVPFYGGALHHDMHHQRPRTNYEPFFTYLDLLAGTAASAVDDAHQQEVETTTTTTATAVACQ